MSQRKSDLGIPLPYTWLNPSTRPSTIGFLEWYWQGTEVLDINISMIGRLYRNEQGWYYVEVLFRGRNVEFVMTAPCVAELGAEVLGNRSESNF